MAQSDLAKALGVNQTTVSRWETGLTKPDPDTARKLVDLARTRRDDADAGLAHMIAASPMIAAVVDLEWKILGVSRGCLEDNRLSRAEVVGRDYRPLMTPEHQSVWAEALEGGLLTDRVVGAVAVFPARNLRREPMFVQCHWTILPNSRHEPRLIVQAETIDEATCRTLHASQPLTLITADDWMTEGISGLAARQDHDEGDVEST